MRPFVQTIRSKVPNWRKTSNICHSWMRLTNKWTSLKQWRCVLSFYPVLKNVDCIASNNLWLPLYCIRSENFKCILFSMNHCTPDCCCILLSRSFCILRWHLPRPGGPTLISHSSGGCFVLCGGGGELIVWQTQGWAPLTGMWGRPQSGASRHTGSEEWQNKSSNPPLKKESL